MNENLKAFVINYKLIPIYQQRLLTKSNKPIDNSIIKYKMDVGFINDLKVKKETRYH